MQVIAIAAAAIQLALGAGDSLKTLGATSPRSVDLVFVVDLSGSMRSLLPEAKQVMHHVASSFKASPTTRSMRVGILLYGDDERDLSRLELTSDLALAERALLSLQNLRIHQELAPTFLAKAVKEFQWDTFAEKHLIMVGNESPHQGRVRVQEAIHAAKSKSITTNVIWCNWLSRQTGNIHAGSASEAERGQWQELAGAGGGFFLEIDIDVVTQLRQMATLEQKRRMEFEQRFREATRAAHRAQLGYLLRKR